ncbi:MAG TPA: glycoside hydrolase family 97 C-terminal domain-containing protein, partial [Pirellulales bacterium]|nr:glycoside hydrolase family 97 C-terminal domain-containing protein [Pirellulales bacterium]
GALTNSEPRKLTIKLDFLGSGSWKLRLWKDGANASENAEHLATEERTVEQGDTLSLRLAPAGGCVACLKKH